MKNKLIFLPLLIAGILSGGLTAQAQWQTQPILIKPGWTAIYLHVDASYTTLNQMVGNDPNNPIAEIWLWEPPAGTIQFVTSPATPVTSSSQWATWQRTGTGVSSTLVSLVGNAAYLVHSLATTNYTWNVQGQPVTPNYAWNTAGENLLDFPTVTNNPPAFDTFLAPAPTFESSAEIYQYTGGNLGPANPFQVFALHATPVTRGQAFWMRSGSYYNTYFGPFSVTVSTAAGVAFGSGSSVYSFHLKNQTAAPVTVMANLIPSEKAPAGQTNIVGVPPLLVRGALSTTNLAYSYTTLNVGTPMSWTLAPQGQNGSDIVVVMGLNRYAMTGNTGDLFAGILRFTDSLNFTELDVPTSAQVASYAGLWVGSATVSQVGNYLKAYQTDQNNNPVLGANGAFVVTGINTNLGAVASPFPLRFILHDDGTNVNMLQRVFYGPNTSSNFIVSTSESLLDPKQLAVARRISAIHLPWTSANLPIPCGGTLAPGGTVTATSVLNYDDQSSNPFLHTFHPDHDNLDAAFQNQLPVGSESYSITRQFTLSVSPPGADFASLTQAGQSFTGAYLETITMGGLGGATRTFNVSGTFALNLLSPISTLSHP